MATFRGLDGEVRIGTGLMGETTSFTVTETTDTIESTAQRASSDARNYLVGLKTFTGSVEVHFDMVDDTVQAQIATGATVVLTFYPAGRDSGSFRYLQGTAKITSIESVSSFDNQTVSATFQFQGTGLLDSDTLSEVAFVSGAGSTVANGYYAESSGDWINIDNPDLVISWDGASDEWEISDDGTVLYTGTGGSITGPWTADTWTANAGAAPVPSVTLQFLAIT